MVLKLQNRVIKTTISFANNLTSTLPDGTVVILPVLNDASFKRTFISKGGVQRDGTVYMRQDFVVNKFPSTADGGLVTAQVSLYNLRDDSSRELERQGYQIEIEAGWEDQTAQAFKGTIMNVVRTKPNPENPDIVTTLYCVSSAEKIQNFCYSNTIETEQDILTILRQIANYVGLEVNDQVGISGTWSGALNGSIDNLFATFATQFNFNFYFTDYSVEIVPVLPVGKLPPIIYNFTPENGIIGIPTITEAGINLTIFLNANVTPGQGFDVDSDFSNFDLGGLNFVGNRVRGEEVQIFSRRIGANRYDGSYQVSEVEHRGSSHEDVWQTTIKGLGAVNLENISQTKRISLT